MFFPAPASQRTILAASTLAFLLVVGCGGGGSAPTPNSTTPATGPTLTKAPLPQAGYVGDTVTFQVVADGTGNAYQWLRNGSAISGATAATYTLPVQLADDQAKFSVRVTSPAGGITTSSEALLDVLYAYPAVAPGQDHTLAITTKGLVYAWGYNGNGQLGVSGQNNMLPARVPLPGPAVQVVAGWGHSLALLADGTVYAWGVNDSGQLGDGSTTAHSTPAKVPGLSGIIAIATGYNHVFAYGQNNSAWIWGSNSSGQLGLGDKTDRPTPQPISVGSLADLSMGRAHTLMVTSSGALVGCGDNMYGQLGLPWSSTVSSYPSLLTLFNSGVKAVRTFNYDSVILDGSGQALASGENAYGGLGDGTHTTRYGFAAMNTSALPAGSTLADVKPGGGHTLLLTTQGAVAATGYNWYGQLGLGSANPTEYDTPQLIPGLTVAGIYTGFESSYAILADLTVKAWGYNSNGRLGDGTGDARYSPTPLAGFSLGPVPTSTQGVRVGSANPISRLSMKALHSSAEENN